MSDIKEKNLEEVSGGTYRLVYGRCRMCDHHNLKYYSKGIKHYYKCPSCGTEYECDENEKPGKIIAESIIPNGTIRTL